MSFSSYQSQEPQQTPAAPLPDVHSVPSTVPLPATHTISASIVPSFTTTAKSITYSDKTSTLYDKNAKFNETNRTESDGSLLTISPVTGASNATAHSEDATANKEAPGTTPDSRDQLFDASFDGSGDVSSLNFAETTFGTDFTDDSLKFTSTSFQPPTTATAAATFTTEQSSSSLSSSASQSPSTTVASSPTIHSHITTQPPPTAGTPTSITTEATFTQETHPPLTTTPMADSLPTTANNTASVSTLTHFDINETSVPDGSSSKSTMPSLGESPTSTSAVTSPEHTMLITTAESSQAHTNIPTSFETTPGYTLEPNAEPVNQTYHTPTGDVVTTKTTTVVPTIEPEAEPTDEPVPEDNDGHGGTAEPEDTSSVKPEADPESTPEEKEKEDADIQPEFNLEAFAEPGPDWEVAKVVWREAWEFHVYFFGLCFAVLGLYCVLSVIRLWYMEHLLSRNYFVTLHLHVICVCVLRATYLLVDAYNSLSLFPAVIDYFLYSTVFPCITSSFSILFYALLLATRVRIMSAKVQKLWVLIVITVIHFTLSIATDIVVGLFSTAPILLFVCQAVFIVWGLLMFIGYLVIFRKLYKGAVKRQRAIKSSSTDRLNSSNPALYSDKYEKHKYTFDRAVKITFASAFFGVAIVGFELYGMFGVYGVLRAVSKPEPWPWWTYHFIVRTLELLMCSSIAYVASQPLKYAARKDRNRLYPYLLPCNMCCCNDTLNQSYDSSTQDIGSDVDNIGWFNKFKAKRHSSALAPYPPHTSEKYSDPDATLLVRKIKQPKPSMLVVEDGFVRIRRDDEILPSNQYELDSNSRSSLSSGLNIPRGAGAANVDVVNSVVNWNFNSEVQRAGFGNDNIHSFSFNDYIIPRAEDQLYSSGEIHPPASDDETDVDIVVTDIDASDEETSGRAAYPESPKSGKSGEIFRPLSMIDLAASMESELDRAFHTGGVDNVDLEARSSLPPSLHDYNSDAFNEPMYDRFCNDDNVFRDYVTGAMTYDSDSEQTKAQSARLLHTPVRRCASDGKPSTPKTRRVENNRYYSLSSVESVGKEDESFDCTSDFRSKRN
ncbi:uncharacterized protein LOC127874407 [Dreissena polymorpha]|nr:uncharacterized protein LOC127874407 [Dreissena polymorpha]